MCVLYCYVPDIALLFNERDQIKPGERGKRTESTRNVVGMGTAGVQPLPLGGLRQAIAPFQASFSSSEKSGLD